MSNATVIPPSLATKNPGISAVSIMKSSSLSSMEVSFIEPLQPLFFSTTPKGGIKINLLGIFKAFYKAKKSISPSFFNDISS